MKKWIALIVASAATSAYAQPADPEGASPPEGPAPVPPGTPALAPQPAPQEPVAHANVNAPVYADSNRDSRIIYVLSLGEAVSPFETVGDWSHVKTVKGPGWVLTKFIADAAPKDPYEDKKPAAPPKPARPPDPRVAMPQVWTTPTGWLLPAAVLYSRTGVDTGGGVQSDQRVGLGDVAEFGVSTTDQVRRKADETAVAKAIQPYVTATFRMGVGENRLFEGQPGLVLGFRKSFERSLEDHQTRIAELTFVASKHLGKHAAIHVGGAFWDASLQGSGTDVALHDHTVYSVSDQLRPFGGIQVEPIDHAEILVDLGWAPEFCYACTGTDQIKLRPELSWGVRYQVADWMALESGVRVPDIGDANLLDAQIFGQVTFTSWALRHAVDDLK